MTAIPVQIESCTLEPKSEHNPHARHANGVRGECVKCGRCAVANPEQFAGPGMGAISRRKAAVATVLATLTEGCPHPRPWGVAPRHADRGIPRGLEVYAVAKATGDRLAVAVEKGKLVGAWGGVALDAVVLVVPESDKYAGDADDFVSQLVARGYANAQLGKPEPVKEAV